MDIQIQSITNPKVKQWMKLLSKKGRKQQNKFLVEGAASVMEAVQADVSAVDCIVYSADRGMPEPLKQAAKHVPRYAVSEAVLKKCTDAVTPQSVFAVVRQPEADISRLIHPQSLVVVCDGIQDPGNLGTIIRSADAAGATGVLVSPDSVDVYHPKVVRSTMGSLFHLPVIVTGLAEALAEAAAQGIHAWSAKPKAEVSLYEADFREASWFIIGNESAGISPEVEQCAANSLYIPMEGKAESLNAAMAATIMLFEAMRQRMFSQIKIPVRE